MDTATERKRIYHDRVSKLVVNNYTNKERVSVDFMYLFREDVGGMLKKTAQYSTKWM